MFCPYLDHELFDFLTSLSVENLLGLHSETIRQTFPQLNQVPFRWWGDSPVSRPDHFRQFALDIAQYAAKQKGTEMMRTGYLATHLSRAIIDPAWSRAIDWFGPTCVYLLNLEAQIEATRNR